jgi:glycerol-1-phosphate dehydrogenase [NAD(P)+]
MEANKTIWPISKIEFIPFPEIQEARPVALVTSAPAWQAVSSRLHLPVVWQTDVVEATLENWDTLRKDFCGEVVYAVGGGLTADAAKYMALKANLPLVCLPTALSVDAVLTGASGIRQDGCVRYIETKTPETLIVDFDVIAAAPPAIRAAGLCDVLSIATGNWDWQFAEERGKNPVGMAYIPYISQAAQAILQGALDCAEAAGRGDPVGLKQLLDCIALEVQLTNQIGHARPEEGSEHYFAYAVENKVGHGKPHADLLGPGILMMATLQGQDTVPLRKAMEACHFRLKDIPTDMLRQTLAELPEYCKKHGFPFGIANTITEKEIAQLLPV